VRERLPQREALFVENLHYSSSLAAALCIYAATVQNRHRQLPIAQQQGHRIEAAVWQQLMLSPHLMPCVATTVVMVATHLGNRVAAHCAGMEGSSGSNAPDSTGQPEQQQQQSSPSSSTSSSNMAICDTFTACQLQLLQLLRLHPAVIDWTLQAWTVNELYGHLQAALGACNDCCDATSAAPQQHLDSAGLTASQQQRQLWRLFPTLLLPCANSLLLPGAPHSTQQQGEWLVQELVGLSGKAVQVSAMMQLPLQGLGLHSETPPAAWVQELLDVLPQLTDRLQQPSRDAGAAAATAVRPTASSSSSTADAGTSSSSSTSSCRPHPAL
jgi:hypothetical protein